MTMHAMPVLLGLVSDVQTTLLLVWQALYTSAATAFTVVLQMTPGTVAMGAMLAWIV